MNRAPEYSQQAVFFDVDDTLYDHLIPFRQALQQVLSTGEEFSYAAAYHRMRYYSDTLSAQFGGTPTHGHDLEEMRTQRFLLALADCGMTIEVSQAAAIQSEYLNRQFDIQLFEGAQSLITGLLDQGRTVGIITNGPPDHQMKKIRALGILNLLPLERIFISGAVGFTKPDRRLFDHVADKLELNPSACCYIGDSWRNDVVGAADAGWNVIWFNHRGALKESAHRPHCEVTSYCELAKKLLDACD